MTIPRYSEQMLPVHWPFVITRFPVINSFYILWHYRWAACEIFDGIFKYLKIYLFLLTDRDFAAKKTRLAAWASSHCSSTGFLREQYVEKLQLYIPVDVFGNCNPRGPLCPRGSNMCNALLKKYKFYLAFENAFCEDYITEKYWEQALEHDMIPVVMGGADYDELVVPKSYINVLDFSSVESLASYLKTLDANSTAYNEYFYWKKQYEVLSTTPWCRLCEMLHNQSLPNKVYWDLGSFWGVKENCMRFSNKIKDQI